MAIKRAQAKLAFLETCAFIFIVINVTNGYLHTYSDSENVMKECENATLLNITTGGNCTCESKTEIICKVPKNKKMDKYLGKISELQYTNVTKMKFVMQTISSEGPVTFATHHKLNLTRLEYFTELRSLTLTSPEKVNIYLLHFTESTFKGCNKIEELHINLPTEIQTDGHGLQPMIQPLRNLKVLNLSDTIGIAYKYMNESIDVLSPSIQVLRLRHFQTIGQNHFYTDLNPLVFFGFYMGVTAFENLTEIDLSYNGFCLVRPEWFKVVPHLRYMDMSHNLLTYSTNAAFFYEMLMLPSVETLFIGHQGYPDQFGTDRGVGRDNLLHTEPLATDKVDSKIPKEFMDCFNVVTLKNITNLFGPQNKLFLCEIILKCVKILFPSFMSFSCDYLPEFPDIWNASCFMFLEFPIGPNLKHLDFSNNFLNLPSHNGITFKNNLCLGNNSLEKINLGNNYYWGNNAKIGDSINNITSINSIDTLTELDLSANNFAINLTRAATNFPNLLYFNLSRNYGNIDADVSLCRDKNIHKLSGLDLSYNDLGHKQIQFGSWELITHCNNLREMHLAGNHLNSSLVIRLEGASHLSLIDLSSNNIQYINPDFARELSGAHMANMTIDLSDNPLTCSCSKKSRDFIHWVNQRSVVLKNFDSIMCAGRSGPMLLKHAHYGELRNKCLSIIPIVASTVSSIVAIIVVLISISIYRVRFRLHYKLFKLRQRISRFIHCKQAEDDESDSIQYEYDAFVSYSSSDDFWVHDVLMKTLEEKYGFKLVIHYRDIMLGENLVQAIDDRMSKSREYILVMSQNFLDSDWCQSEMEAAYRESLRRRGCIIVIVLGEVPTNIENPTARVILDRYNYLQWKLSDRGAGDHENVHQRKMFWIKLVSHLYGDTSTCCCCCGPLGPKAIGYKEVQEYF